MLPDFIKDFKKLKKNYPTLKQDLEVFVNNEIYFKGDKEKEDRKRILKYYSDEK